MTPLPAAEVRRRGTRIRRRNNALAAVGGLAAVAAIAVPFAVFAGNQASTPEPQPAPPSVEWQTTIPGSFDLSTDMSDDQTEVTTSDEALVTANICGVGWYVLPQPSDQLSASMENAGSEGGHDRHLVVFDDAQQATLAMNQFAQAPTNCDGTYSDEGFRYEMFPVDASGSSADSSSAWVQALHDETSLTGEGYVTVAQQVGNAILIDSTISNGVGDETVRQDGTDHLVERSEQVIAEMCVFSATGCGTSDTAEDPAVGEGAVPAIPGDFPLDAGLPSGGLDETVPSPEPTSCDKLPQEPDTVETANAQWRSISEIRDRQLMTFATQAEAERYVEDLVTVFCPEDDMGRGATRETVVYPGTLGDYSAVAVSHNELAGEVDPGLVLTHVVRVGRAVLLSQRIDEGFTWSGDVERESGILVDDSSTELEPVAVAMCTFTETGC